MQSWERELCGPGRVDGGRGRLGDELELNKMDTLIMQMSRVSRAVAEVSESCLCKSICPLKVSYDLVVWAYGNVIVFNMMQPLEALGKRHLVSNHPRCSSSSSS